MDSSNEKRLRRLTGLGDGLWELRRSGSWCDVTVAANGVTFLCHKAVLCAMSPYFTAMFTHDMKESRDSVVTLHEVEPELLEAILECIYTGVDIVTEDNVKDVLEIASLMQISSILEQCESHFSATLSVSNFIDIWFTAKKYSFENLEEHVWSFMLENFSKLCEKEDLTQLPLDTLTALLRDDNLNAKSEDIVCEAAIKWLSADLENRKAQGPVLLSSLRIPNCSSEYVLQNLSHRDTFKVIQGSQEMLQEAFMIHMCPAKKSAFSAVQMTHRATSIQNDVMVIMYGFNSSDSKKFGMLCFSFLGRKWYQLPSLSENIGPKFAACTFGDDIYISGGQCNREGFYRFQASTCAWTSLPKMPTGRNQHVMAAVSDIIYTLGGDGVKIIEGYQVKDASWEKYGELLNPVSYAVAVVCEQTILVLGKCQRANKTVQRFDTTTNQVTHIDTISQLRLGFHAVVNGNVNYVISSDGQVVVTSDKMSSIVGKIDKFNELEFGVTLYRGRFYIASSSWDFTSWKIRVVNPVTLNIDETIRMPSGTTRCILSPINDVYDNNNSVACCRIAISKRFLLGNEIPVSKYKK